MKTKFSYMQNKPYYSICEKSCVCASFFLSFFFFQFSGLIQIVRLINLQLFSVKKKKTSSAQKAVRACFFFSTPHLLTLGWLNFCRHLTDSLQMDYPFQIACVQPPPPLRKNRRRGVCGEGATVHRLVSDG